MSPVPCESERLGYVEGSEPEAVRLYPWENVGEGVIVEEFSKSLGLLGPKFWNVSRDDMTLRRSRRIFL